MTQPLNFTPKAIADLMTFDTTGAPRARAAMEFLIAKLREAQVFVLPDHGVLLDRFKTRPEVPGLMFNSPFPVVALEYTAIEEKRYDPFYTAARCSRRISLVWRSDEPFPPSLGPLAKLTFGPGVFIQSIAYYDDEQRWMPVMGAIFLPHDGEWSPTDERPSPFIDAMKAGGRIAPDTKGYPVSVVPLFLEACYATVERLGSQAATEDIIRADSMDEINAFVDLAMALACRNVSFKRHDAPARLNRQRIIAGKLPLTDFHVLELGGADFGGAGQGGSGERSAPRSHLRRGHIRRLSPDRLTWVNQSIVRGRGFLEKAYAI